MKNINLLKDSLEKLNIKYSDVQIDQLSRYYDLLIEWNSKMNLTSITEEDEVITKHFIDSLLISQVINLKEIDSLVDIGTGAGFPSMPIKIMFPHVKMTLLDSLNKRITFLNHVTDILVLEDIECVHGRAEQFGKNKDYREKFDLCVSRAVSNLAVLSEYCIPFVKVDGLFVAYKSIDCMEEVNHSRNAITTLGGELIDVKEMAIPNSSIKRAFALIKKVSSTDIKYPRKEGKPSKKPL